MDNVNSRSGCHNDFLTQDIRPLAQTLRVTEAQPLLSRRALLISPTPMIIKRQIRRSRLRRHRQRTHKIRIQLTAPRTTHTETHTFRLLETV